MPENIEIRVVANGFVITVTTEDDSKEFVYDSQRKVISKIKSLLDAATEA